MALKELKRIITEVQDLSTVQSNVREFTLQLNGFILDGVILENQPIGTATTDIAHKLGRPYKGWHLIDIQGDARIWRDTTSTSDNAKFLPLKASSSVTVSLWVF